MAVLTAEFLSKLKASAEVQRQKSAVQMHQAEGAAAMIEVLIKHLSKPEDSTAAQPTNL
jgi:hypothetical protein